MIVSIERKYFDLDGNPRTLNEMIQLEPGWAASRIRKCERLEALAREPVGDLIVSEDGIEFVQLSDCEAGHVYAAPPDCVERTHYDRLLNGIKEHRYRSGCACHIDPDTDEIVEWCAQHAELKQRLTELEAELDSIMKHPPCRECGALDPAEAEIRCNCGGDKDHCHGCDLWPKD